jgi:hypothetical protein
MTEAKWFEKPVRMMRWDLLGEYARIKQLDLDAWAKEKKEKWHINCDWIVGAPGSAPGAGYMTTFAAEGFERYPGFEDFDSIREYLPHARKYGIKVVVYLNMHWYSYEFSARHPGWEQLTSTGEPYGRLHPLYGNGTTFCVNSPWRDWAFKLIQETAKAGADGVFLDGPVVYPDSCYCDHCQDRFRDKFGEEIPGENWKDDLWKKFLLFREDSMAGFLRDAGAHLKKVDPESVIFLNAGGYRASGWRVARDIQKVGPYQHFNAAEEFFHPHPSPHNLFASALMAKYLEAGGKPAVVFTHHALGEWHYKFLPSWEIKLAIAQTVACGANTWFAFFGKAYDQDESGMQAAGEIQGFHERNEEYYNSAKSAATIAIHNSAQTAMFYISEQSELYRDLGTGKEQDLIADLGTGKTAVDWARRKSICETHLENSFVGYSSILFRQHIPFDVILDDHITDEGLKRYRTLILPNSACLSDPQVRAIETFVKSGGRLVASFESGLFDELGNLREVPALDKILGVRERREMLPAMLGENYMRVVRGLLSLPAGLLLPRGPFCLKVEPAANADAPVLFLEPIRSLYMPLPNESPYPALILNHYGKGEIAYFPQLIGSFYATHRIEDTEGLIASTIREMDDSIPLRVNAPPTVLVDLKTQGSGNRHVIHMVNCSGDMQRPVTRILPVGGIEVELKGEGIRMARTLTDNHELGLIRKGEWVKMTLPRLDFYEVIVTE